MLVVELHSNESQTCIYIYFFMKGMYVILNVPRGQTLQLVKLKGTKIYSVKIQLLLFLNAARWHKTLCCKSELTQEVILKKNVLFNIY